MSVFFTSALSCLGACYSDAVFMHKKPHTVGYNFELWIKLKSYNSLKQVMILQEKHTL